MRPLVPDHIGQLVPYQPGKPIGEVQRELGIDDVVKLASNENPLGPSPKAMAAVQRAAADLNLYPDGGCFYLKQWLAGQFGCDAGEILLGNGSNELLELLIRTFMLPGQNIVTSASSFIVYKLAARACGYDVREAPLTAERGYDLDGLFGRIDQDTRLVFIANPNNPTGSYLNATEIDRFVEAVDGRCDDPPILVFDEAYFEYVDASDYPDTLALRTRRPRTVVMRTFSKAYGLAGLRCGYALTDAEMVAGVDRVRAPFNVNSLAQAGAIAALDDTEFLARTIAANREGKALLERELTARGLGVTPTQTNFFLVDFGADARPIFQALMRQGVITRPMGGYGLPTSLRITIGLPEQNERLLRAIDAVRA